MQRPQFSKQLSAVFVLGLELNTIDLVFSRNLVSKSAVIKPLSDDKLPADISGPLHNNNGCISI